MNEENKFYARYWIRRFLCEYLTNIRNLSANTLKSPYRDAIRLLMPFIAKCEKKKKKKKEVDKILLTDITDTRVADFLESLEKTGHVQSRPEISDWLLFCSLAKYVSANSPEHIEWSRNIRNIPVKKTRRTLITYLEKEEMNALLDAPDKKYKPKGGEIMPSYFFLYNTGARAEEEATLLIRIYPYPRKKGLGCSDYNGKGNKTRRCPLWQHTRVRQLSPLSKNRTEG